MLSANKPRMRSILKDSDSQWSRETLSNLLPSGSMSFTSNMSSNSTPAILCNCMKTRLKKQPGGSQWTKVNHSTQASYDTAFSCQQQSN